MQQCENVGHEREARSRIPGTETGLGNGLQKEDHHACAGLTELLASGRCGETGVPILLYLNLPRGALLSW